MTLAKWGLRRGVILETTSGDPPGRHEMIRRVAGYRRVRRDRETVGMSEKVCFADDYLDQAVTALHASGSSDMLYGDGRDSHDVFARAADMWDAPRRRLHYARTAILFAAISAEAYINAFIFAPKRFTATDARAIERLTTTVDKFVLAPRLSGHDIFDRGGEPVTSMNTLFALRNDLVHPRPRTYEASGDFNEPHGFEELNPEVAARMIAAVAHAGWRLTSPPFGEASPTTTLYYEERRRLISYGRAARVHLATAVDAPKPPLDGQLLRAADKRRRRSARA